MPIFKKILVIDNFDSFTFNLVDYFEQLGCHVDVYRNTIDPPIIDALRPELIVLSPGPSIPRRAGNLMAIIDHAHKQIPIFGVCLGHEAIIEYFGGSLKLTQPIHGKASAIRHDGQTIFEGLEPDFMGGRYHSLVADRVPDDLEISATHNDLVMAVRHKKLPIEGVQFHPESVLTMKRGNGFKIIENIVHKHFSNV